MTTSSFKPKSKRESLPNASIASEYGPPPLQGIKLLSISNTLENSDRNLDDDLIYIDAVCRDIFLSNNQSDQKEDIQKVNTGPYESTNQDRLDILANELESDPSGSMESRSKADQSYLQRHFKQKIKYFAAIPYVGSVQNVSSAIEFSIREQGMEILRKSAQNDCQFCDSKEILQAQHIARLVAWRQGTMNALHQQFSSRK